jgi:hypothetical protein
MSNGNAAIEVDAPCFSARFFLPGRQGNLDFSLDTDAEPVYNNPVVWAISSVGRAPDS